MTAIVALSKSDNTSFVQLISGRAELVKVKQYHVFASRMSQVRRDYYTSVPKPLASL